MVNFIQTWTLFTIVNCIFININRILYSELRSVSLICLIFLSQQASINISITMPGFVILSSLAGASVLRQNREFMIMNSFPRIKYLAVFC